MKKYIEELTNEELISVYDVNAKLREDVFELMAESESFFVSDMLSAFERGAIDYSLDVSGYNNYLIVKNITKFLDGVRSAHKDYYFLSADGVDALKRAEELNERLNDMGYELSATNYRRLEKRVDELVEVLHDEIYKEIRNIYDSCYEDEIIEDYYLSTYVDTQLCTGAFYIDEAYKLYEEIHTVKCYA